MHNAGVFVTLTNKGPSASHSTFTRWPSSHPVQRSRAGVITGNTPRKSQGPERVSSWPRQLTGQQEKQSGHGFSDTWSCAPSSVPFLLSPGGTQARGSWSRDMGNTGGVNATALSTPEAAWLSCLAKECHRSLSFRKPCSPHTSYKLPVSFIFPLTQPGEGSTEATASPNILAQRDPLLWYVPLNPPTCPSAGVQPPLPAYLWLLGLRVVAEGI